ncbi:aquaporin-4-like isoform X2 [Salminus brasiliensis]|uniref:aquaporin-4-like isoform X2 n=1 Tax=Salminus brasiliensis TaxID=930266 RepID=UPI003B837A25
MAAFKGIWTKDFWRAVSGEFLATLIFVLLSLGSTINWAAGTENPPPADLVLISLCFGLSIATMVQCFGHISGGHINPAVTAAMVVTQKMSLAKALFYIAAQCLGAIVGAGVLFLVTPSTVRGGLGVTAVNSHISVGHALVVELLITFELVFTVFSTCDHKRSDLKGSASLAIGLAVVIGHLFAVYWVGPILGGILAAALYEYLYCPDPGLKKRCREMFVKDDSGKYKEVECPSNHRTGESDNIVIKPGSSSDAEKAEKKESFQDSSGDVLSSV